jgi:hypothetical protein
MIFCKYEDLENDWTDIIIFSEWREVKLWISYLNFCGICLLAESEVEADSERKASKTPQSRDGDSCLADGPWSTNRGGESVVL